MKHLKDKIEESLIMSYDSEKLIKKLKIFFNIEEIHKQESKSNIQYFSFKLSEEEFNKVYDEKLYKILDFYGYYITSIKHLNDINKYIISFEPIFGKKCNDLVYNKCNGIIYHVTKEKFISNIKKKGLIPLERSVYRNFSERIFLSCGNTNEEIIDNINTIINQISNNDYIILRVDLNKYHYNVDFYYDPAEDNIHNFIYCNAYFPSFMIEEIGNINDLKELLKNDKKIKEGRYINQKIGKLYIEEL